MDNQDKQNMRFSIIEAVETLSEIADMDIEHGVGVSQTHETPVDEEKINYRSVKWVNKEDAEKGLQVVKETFRVILNFLRHFYREEITYVPDLKAVEGIKTIMILVGEAAKKLDKYTQLFHLSNNKSVVELKEYKKLQEFYLTKIAHKVDEGQLGKWILALSKMSYLRNEEIKLVGKANLQTKHVFVDLDSVRRDSEYELFFLRKEDGTRFYSPRLLRNMKLISDFGSYYEGKAIEDTLEDVQVWVDRYYQQAALSIIKSTCSLRDRYYREAFQYKDNELVHALGYCLMALVMCSQQRNSIKYDAVKTCTDYFKDFQNFLRKALRTSEYARLVTYPPNDTNRAGQCLLNLTHTLCKAFYFCCDGYQNSAPEFFNLFEAAEQPEDDHLSVSTEWGRLNNEYASLHKLLKGHQNAPLLKTLNVLDEGDSHIFDPLLQGCMPTLLYHLSYDGKKIVNVRMGCPIIQDYINKAVVNDEFKALLRSCNEESDIKSVLILNLQDRTSWKDHVRCAVLEELQHNSDFCDVLTVATIAKDTDFYHQLPPYDLDNQTEAFLQSFCEHFGDESSGYYFPKALQEHLDANFLEGILNGIHNIFFNNKNMLLRDPRLNFIEIFDVFLTLKILEAAKPDCFCLLCKDGVDGSAAMNALLYCFLKIVNNEERMTPSEWKELNVLLHVPALVVRERLIQQDKFARFISALKTIETVKDEYGPQKFVRIFHETFSQFYQTTILKSQALPINSAI